MVMVLLAEHIYAYRAITGLSFALDVTEVRYIVLATVPVGSGAPVYWRPVVAIRQLIGGAASTLKVTAGTVNEIGA
jgi:hypothetical protein